MQVAAWAQVDGSGVTFDSSTGFELPSGAMRSPDVAWVRRTRLARLTAAQKERFLPLCPDFVVELLSPSDSLSMTQEKLEEYLANGAQLGWLIDPTPRRVYVYRPGAAVESLDNPMHLAGDPVLPGFALDLAPIWEPGF
jgi:Uma2 family endonuclease